MRFSSIFQSSPKVPPERPREQPRPELEPEAAAVPQPGPAAAPPVPEDLDARVRLIGEWQLGEG